MSENKLLHYRYIKQETIGKGGFGTIYKAYDIITKKNVALKEENLFSGYDQLISERELYFKLGEQIGFLEVFDFFSTSKYRYLAFTLVDKCLESKINEIGKKLNLKSTLQVARQLIIQIETLHKNDIIHRDIKPENLAMGLDEESTKLFILDLGMSKIFKYRNVHIPFRDDKSFKGTTRYASINSHKNYELSRRDDLESIAYVLIYLQKGSLPWQYKEGDKHEKDYQVYLEKVNISIEKLCEGLETEFKIFLTYARNLTFKKKPDYTMLRKIFDDLFKKHQFEDDDLYQWTRTDDYASIKRRKEIRKKNKENKEIMRLRAIEAQKKKLQRKNMFMGSSQDLFFLPSIPLEERRAIVINCMKGAHFPTSIPPIYPPFKHNFMKATHIIQDIPLVSPEQEYPNVDVTATDFIEANNVIQDVLETKPSSPGIFFYNAANSPINFNEASDLFKSTSSASIFNVYDVATKPIEASNHIQDGYISSSKQVSTNADDVPINLIEDSTCVQGVLLTLPPKSPPKVDDTVVNSIALINAMQYVSLEGNPFGQKSKPGSSQQDCSKPDDLAVHHPNQTRNKILNMPLEGSSIITKTKSDQDHTSKINAAAVNRDINLIIDEYLPKSITPDTLDKNNLPTTIKSNIELKTRTLSNEKKRKAEVDLYLNILPKKSRKEQQARKLVLATQQAMDEQKHFEHILEEKRQEYVQRRNMQYKEHNPLRSENLPPFQQYHVPYIPTALFKPTFGGKIGITNDDSLEPYLLL